MQCTHPQTCRLGWGESPSTLRNSALPLVYAPSEYSAQTWSRSWHTSLLDVGLNCTLRVTTGSLQPTPVEQVPVFACIPAAELRGQAARLALARLAMDPDHLLHHTITREETQPGLKSRGPFCHKWKRPTYPMRQRPTGLLGCNQRSGNRPTAGYMNILCHHPSAAQDLTFPDKFSLMKNMLIFKFSL